MSSALLADAFRHMAWADAATWTRVLSSPDARGDQDLLDRLHHVHAVQFLFFHAIGNTSPAPPGRDELDGATGMAHWAAGVSTSLLSLLSAQADADLSRVIVLPFAERIRKRFGTLADVLQQVLWHTTHHRGQVLTRLRALGVEPPLVDFVAWVWQGRPPAAWPAS